MEAKRKQLERRLHELVETNTELQVALERYSESNVQLAERIAQGAPLIEAMESMGGAAVREDINGALENVAKARHRVRVAMCILAIEQGTSLSDLARSLGISRQLASRLAAESGRMDP